MTKSAGPALKKAYQEFGQQVQFITLYIREAHPGENYPQPKTFGEKMAHARAYKERDGIPWPVAVDDIEGRLHRVLDEKANATYIIDMDGNVAFRTIWSNDYDTLNEALLKVVETKHGAVGESQKQMIPMMRAIGELYDTLHSSGHNAQTDMIREIPPLYGIGRVAALFRPLPPLARTLSAILAIGMAAGIVTTLLSRRRS